jgi:hypothetical protein
LSNCNDICDLVADCIENDPDVGDTIINILNEAGIFPTDGDTPPKYLSPDKLAANLLPDGYTCDNDHLFGMARWIVTNLHEGPLQLLEQIENATNQVEVLSILVDNVEGLSYIGSVVEMVAWFQDQLLEYYELAWSTTVYDELSCLVYCQIQPACAVSIPNILDAYEVAIQESFTLPVVLDSISDLWEWQDALNFESAAAIATVASFHWIVIQALAFGSSALQYVAGIRSLEMVIALGANDTDGDWDLLCEECPDGWVKTFDFRLGEQLGWYPNQIPTGTHPNFDRAVWAGDGWTRSVANGGTIIIQLDFDWPDDCVVEQVQWLIENQGTSSFNLTYGLPYTNGTSNGTEDPDGTNTANPNWIQGTRTGLGIEHSVIPVASQKLTVVTLRGTGEEPTWP